MNEEWFYIGNDGSQQGPISQQELFAKGLNGDTPVWKNGMPNWQKLNEIPGFAQSQTFTQQPVYQQPVYQQNGFNNNNNTNYLGPKPDNYLVWAILSTVLCCAPFGIASIVFSTKVDTLYYQGKLQEAQEAAKKAKTWFIVSIISAAAFWIIYLAIYGAIIFAAIKNDL